MFLCLAQSIRVTRAQPHIPEISLSTLLVNDTINDFGGNHPKTTHNTSTLNTGETSSNYSVKLSLCPHKSSYGTFLDSLTVDLFKIPDVNQRLKRRHTAPTFQTIFELFWKNSSCVSGRMYLWALYVRMFVARANKVEGTISWCLGTNEILPST